MDAVINTIETRAPAMSGLERYRQDSRFMEARPGWLMLAVGSQHGTPIHSSKAVEIRPFRLSEARRKRGVHV